MYQDQTPPDYSERGNQALEDLGWSDLWADVGSQGLDPQFKEFTRRIVFGQLYAREGLSIRDRELLVMALIIAQGSEHGIKPHFRLCHAVGISEDDVRELIYTVCLYSGWPKGSQARVWLNEVLQEADSSWPAELRSKVVDEG
jgi:4-carboxymuconolactone decarboxylase